MRHLSRSPTKSLGDRSPGRRARSNESSYPALWRGMCRSKAPAIMSLHFSDLPERGERGGLFTGSGTRGTRGTMPGMWRKSGDRAKSGQAFAPRPIVSARSQLARRNIRRPAKIQIVPRDTNWSPVKLRHAAQFCARIKRDNGRAGCAGPPCGLGAGEEGAGEVGEFGLGQVVEMGDQGRRVRSCPGVSPPSCPPRQAGLLTGT